MADLARSNDQPLAASNTELSIIDDQPNDVPIEAEEGWQVIMHDENEGKMVIVNQQTKELDIYVSVTRSRWASQMRNKTLAAPSESASDSDTCPVCHQTVNIPAHEHETSDELVLATPHQTEDQVYVDPSYFAALNSVSEAAPSPAPVTEPVAAPSRLEHLMNGGYYRRFFQEDKRLGSGGYGAVYLVRHQIRGVDLGHYALKKVPCGEDEEWLVRVLREVTVLQALTKHPHLVNYKHAWLELDQIADFGPQVPCLFILMEYANSGNLYDYVVRSQVKLSANELRVRKKKGDLLAAVALTADLVWSFFLDILLGLDCMHACDMIHHDLKPQNILLHATALNGSVAARGGSEQTPTITCLISDFGTSEALKGIAVTSEHDSEQRNNHLGTLEWLAPEVVRETINSTSSEVTDQQMRMRGDIWSLGMILYFMLCKRLPYKNSTLDQILDMEALKREISEFSHVTYPADCAVPEDLKALVEMMLRAEPRDRPTTQQLLSHVTVVQKLAALHRTMSYHESIVQHNVREVSTTQLSRDPPPPPRDQSRDQLALSSDSISLSDSTSSLPRLITPPITRRASEINTRTTAQTSTATDAKNSAIPKKDPGRTKFSNRFSRQNARASSYFKPNSFTNGIPSSGIPRSPRATNNIPSSFMASPPPSLGSTPLPSYDDLFEYFKTNKMVAPNTAVNAPAVKVPASVSAVPRWKEVANLVLFLLRLAQCSIGCSSLARTSTTHNVVLAVLAAVTLLLSVHKRTKIPQIVITCLLWLWTGSYYLSGYYCTPLLADITADALTAPSRAALAYATLCYALALVLLFAEQQIERYMGWSTEQDSKEQKSYANGEVDWNAVRQQLQQLKKRR